MGTQSDRFYSSFDSASQFLLKKSFRKKKDELLSDSSARSAFLSNHSLLNHQTVGFKVRCYRSGEMTGAQYSTGSRFSFVPPVRSGSVETNSFTQQALSKIRRSIECAESDIMWRFCTLTFSPSVLHPWELTENGTVRHDFAKHKLKKFLDACSVKQRRLNRRLDYVWIAELQDNGNIHFHILWNQFFAITYLTKIWSQGKNAVDICLMKNPLHASAYMRKYLTKDNDSLIQGNRYNISSGLRETMKPDEKKIVEVPVLEIANYSENPVHALTDALKAMKEDIESRGGTVLDFGFSVPAPRNAKEYTSKDGARKKSRGVDRRLASRLLNCLQSVPGVPF
jgi:hypothetical protein